MGEREGVGGTGGRNSAFSSLEHRRAGTVEKREFIRH